MKAGFRKPSSKKSLKARIMVKRKRQTKEVIIPGHGEKEQIG